MLISQIITIYPWDQWVNSHYGEDDSVSSIPDVTGPRGSPMPRLFEIINGSVVRPLVSATRNSYIFSIIVSRQQPGLFQGRFRA